MRKEAEELLNALHKNAQEDAHDATNPVTDLFANYPADVAAALLAESCEGLARDVIGYNIIPLLRPSLQNEDVFRAMIDVASDSKRDEVFRHVLLDALDGSIRRGLKKALRGADSLWKDYCLLLRSVAGDDSQGINVQVKSVRALARDDSPESLEVVRKALANKSPQIVDAAARTVHYWHRAGKPIPKDALELLRSYAGQAPRQSLQAPSLLAAVAELEGPGSPTIRQLADQAETDSDIARVIGAAGEYLDDETYGQLVDKSARSPSSTAALFIQELNAEGSDGRLERLSALGNLGARQLLELRAVGSAEPDSSRIDAASPSSLQSSAPAPSASFSQSVFGSFSAGFHKGDALYRDLITNPLWREHWHAGVYLGFSYTSSTGQGSMNGIHAASLFGDTLHYFTADSNFGSPETNVAGRMSELRQSFITAFKEGEGDDIPYHGARTLDFMTPQQRNAVVATAYGLYGKGISYTFEDMLDYKGWDWTGQISDIDETRCDGVVEYSYEKNGLRVCNGEKSTLWNIASAGTEHPENHNDLHTYGYDVGELCPRIQAGNHGHGNDTHFVQSLANPPQVESFSLTPESLAPAIRFFIEAPNYTAALVRITVSKDGGPFFFLRSDSGTGLLGDWNFRSVSTGVLNTVNWRGKTVGGPDFTGQNGNYTFRLVAVDFGGNVSDTVQSSLAVSWASNVKIDLINYDPPGLDQYGEYVVLRNFGTAPQNLSGWRINDVANHVYAFPWFNLAPGDAVRLWTGPGTNDSHNLYWGRSQAVWNNTGDTALLYNAGGQLVSQYTYSPTTLTKS